MNVTTSISARRLTELACGAVAISLLLGQVEAPGQSVRVDAAKFIDKSLPDCGLQKAIDSVPDGGMLVIPKGTHLLRRSLVLRANMTLSGVGPETVLTVVSLPPCSPLAAVAEKGATSVRVMDGSRFEAGMQVAIRDSDHVGWGTSHAIITKVKGDVLELDAPLERTYQPNRNGYVGHLFPALYAKDQPKLTIQFLRITGPKVPTPFRDFVMSALHLVNCSGSLVTHCTIEDWHSDAFSVQRGSNIRIMDNIARHNRGHGFHPGTGLEDSFWSGNLGEQNGDFGLYYCMKVKRGICSHNIFRWNARHGVGRLGDAGDVDNLVFDNLFDNNGEAGVHVGWQNGVPAGWEKGTANFVIGNRFLDNGKAGVLLEFATKNVIAKNTFQGGKAIQLGKDSTDNYLAANGPNDPAFPADIPPERLKLLDDLLDRDAKNMQAWAAFKKTLHAPK
jgi:parallel beta-helix repeat protein